MNRKNKGVNQTTLREFARYHLVPASWPAIVDEVTWKTTQESLDFAHEKARTRLATKEKRDYLLTGLLRCAECGGRLMGATGHGTKSTHRYYIHRPVKGKKVACSMNWTPADALEAPVMERLGRVLEDQGYLDSLELKIVKINEGREHDWKTEKGGLEADLSGIESEIKKTIQLQTKCDDLTVDDAFKDTLRELSDKKRNKKVRLEEINSLLSDLVNPKEAREAIKVNVAIFRKAFAKAHGTIRKRLLGLVFDGLTLGNCELNLYYNETVASAEAIQQISIQKSSEDSSGDSPLNSKILQFKNSVRRNASFGLPPRGGRDQKVFLQAVVEIGRPAMAIHASDQLHDIIRLSSPCRHGLILKTVEFSRSGMSHSWIARELNVTEGWVKSALARERKISEHVTDGAACQANMRTFRAWHGAAPYGFEVLDCRLIENQREIKVVQKIIGLWNSGRGPAAIARELNAAKFKTRKSKAWDHSVVTGIILRAQDDAGPYTKFSNGLRPYKSRRSPKSQKGGLN